MKNLFEHLTWTQYKVAEACKTIHNEICLTASEKLAVRQVKYLHGASEYATRWNIATQCEICARSAQVKDIY